MLVFLGVVLGYSEILDETLEDFILEAENQNIQWMHDARQLLGAFSDQLHYLNQSLNQLFQRLLIMLTKSCQKAV